MQKRFIKLLYIWSRLHCKFQHRNNVEIKNNQQLHTEQTITHTISHCTRYKQCRNTKSQKLVTQPDNQTTNTWNQSRRKPNYANTKSKSTNRNYSSINKSLFTSIASNNKAVRRSKTKKNKTNEIGKLPQNKLRIAFANARGIKSKMQSLKRIIL